MCLSLAAGTFWSANHAAKNAARVRFVVTAQQTLISMQEATHSRVESLDHGTALAVLDPVFRAQLSRLRQSDAGFGLGDATAASQPIADVHGVVSSAELPYFKRYELLLIATPEKLLLFNRSRPSAHSTPLGNIPLLEAADHQETAFGFVPGNAAPLADMGAKADELYLVIAKRISVAGQNFGYIIVGESVRGGLLKDLDRVSQAHTGIALQGQVWSRNATAQSVAQGFLSSQPPPATATGEARTDFTWMGNEYFVTQTAAGLLLVKPIAEELELLAAELRTEFLVFIAPLAVLALLAAAAFAQYFSRPIVALTEEVMKVKAGNYAAKMPVLRGDEVGELARAFNEMTESLSALRIDPLTGLYSEHYLKDTLAFELVHSATHTRPLALLNLRLFDFENTLQALGEDAMRDRLQHFAEHLTGQHKRVKDVAARGDEDEFWLLLVDTDLAAARTLCQQVLDDRHASMPQLHLGLAVLNSHISDVEGFMDAARTATEEGRKSGPGRLGLARGTTLATPRSP